VLGALRLGRESSLAELEPEPDPDRPENSAIGHRELADAVRAGDQLALEIVDEAANYMSAGLISIINFYNPPRLILGGGVVGEIDLFFRRAERHARQGSLIVPQKKIEIVRAEMGENPGIVGAAVLAMQIA
jgi:glucokinase